MTASEDVGPPVPVREMRAAFAVRWDPGDDDCAFSRLATGRLGGTLLRAKVSTARIRPSLSVDGDLVLPAVIDSLDGFDLREDFTVVEEPDPLCLITVYAQSDGPVLDVLFEATDTQPVAVSWSGLRRLTDELLHLVTSVLDALDEDTTFGPLACGDLVGAGVLRLGDPSDCLDLPILPRPQLGSWRAGGVVVEESDQPVFGDLMSNRRLLGWLDRYSLRHARGEWAEALVASEAAMEAGMRAILDGLLIDHGWESRDLSGKDVPNNAKSMLSAIQAHLGGHWTPVRDDFAELWDMRNRALHRSDYITQTDVEHAELLTGSFPQIVAARLAVPEVAKRHPVTAYLYSHELVSTLGADVFEHVGTAVDGQAVDDIRALNDSAHPGRRATVTANACTRGAAALWSSA